MPEISKKIAGKKYMWDGNTYETEESARELEQTYKGDNFETELLNEDGKFLVYTRRVVTDVVVEREAP